MVRIFTHKRYMCGRNVIYTPNEYFKHIVADAVNFGGYALSERAKTMIAKEPGVLKISGAKIYTKYGEMSLTDIPFKTKLLIIMEFLSASEYDDVLNVSELEAGFDDILDYAEELGIDLFRSARCFTYYRNQPAAYALINDDTQPTYLREKMYARPWSALCFNDDFKYGYETNIAFATENRSYDLWFCSRQSVIKADSVWQKQSIIRDMRLAAADSSAKITLSDKYSYDDVSMPAAQLIYVDRSNINDVLDRFGHSDKPYIIFCDGDDNTNYLLWHKCKNKPINIFAICSSVTNTDDEDTELIESEVPATDDTEAVYNYALNDMFTLIDKSEYEFRDLDDGCDMIDI